MFTEGRMDVKIRVLNFPLNSLLTDIVGGLPGGFEEICRGAVMIMFE